MRAAIALIALLVPASPAAAWEFSADPVCTLSQTTDTTDVAVTYDPRQPEPYAIAITRGEPWGAGAIFGILFDGARPLTITTNRHATSDGGTTLTVSDRGFANVLLGLEMGGVARAFLGDTEVSIPLAGAAPEVEKFRACTEGGLA